MNIMLDGKTALITGAAKRLGWACAEAIASQGAKVILHYNTSAGLIESRVETLRERGVSAWALQCNLSEPAAATALIGRACEVSGGPINILINNASSFHKSTLLEFNAEQLLGDVNLNALSPFLIGREFYKQNCEGHIINFLDCRMVDYDAEHVAYHLSKRMFHALTRMMALEFAPSLRVNAVAPGLILPPEGKDEQYLRDLAHTNPLAMHGGVEDVAQAVLFLLKSRFITGQIIFVDGGRNLKGNFYG